MNSTKKYATWYSEDDKGTTHAHYPSIESDKYGEVFERDYKPQIEECVVALQVMSGMVLAISKDGSPCEVSPFKLSSECAKCYIRRSAYVLPKDEEDSDDSKIKIQCPHWAAKRIYEHMKMLELLTQLQNGGYVWCRECDQRWYPRRYRCMHQDWYLPGYAIFENKPCRFIPGVNLCEL